MVTAARYAFLLLSWLFVAGLLFQTFLAGLGLFGDPETFAVHVNVGWILHLVPILVLIAAALARAGARNLWLALALAIVVFVTPIFPLLRADVPAAAALHPVFALIAFGLGFVVARAAWRLVQETRPGQLEPAVDRG